MSQIESSIGASVPAEGSVATVTGASPASQGTTSAPSEQTASRATTEGVQENQTTQGDPFGAEALFAGVPSLEELNAAAEKNTPYAKSLIQLRTALEPLKTQFNELQTRFSPYEPVLERFEQPEQLQEIIDLKESLIGWANDPQTGEPIPSTEKGAQLLHERYPQHANVLLAELAEMPVYDSVTGRTMPRWEVMLHGMAEDPVEKAKAAQILGLVEPSAVAPQWQPTDEEINAIPQNSLAPTEEEKALQNVYRGLPYEKREELKLASPDFVRDYLQDQQLKQQLVARDRQYQETQRQEQQQREQYINSQAQQAAQTYVDTQLTQALTTFHESVVQQCNFIKPLDPQNLPQGFTPEQAQQMNQQIADSNLAEAAQITGTIVGLLNPQVRPYILPLLQKIGAVDDKFLSQLDTAASTFGNNARNYGNLTFRQKLNANGQGYQPGQDVTQMSNEASRSLKQMVGLANQIRGKLMEKRSQFFELKATEHNQILNGAGTVRPPINGQGYNPTTAPHSANRIPAQGLSREDMARLYG